MTSYRISFFIVLCLQTSLAAAQSEQRLCTKSPYSGISLCNLCVLCVSVVWFYSEFINHRDTEDTEVAQRRARSRLFVQSGRVMSERNTEKHDCYSAEACVPELMRWLHRLNAYSFS